MEKLVMVMLLGLSHVPNSMSTWDRCGGRLERALDSMQRETTKRNNRHDDDEPGIVYQRTLASAPFIMTVGRVAVKLPLDQNHPNTWAKVEKCNFEPTNQSLRSRVMMSDLTVSGVVSLVPQEKRLSIIGESCRMTLRLRRAGIDFTTSPISRSRGQMRIRTESSFLEPRFASIYAYGCRPVGRVDRQIKRQDKLQYYQSGDFNYESPEPRNEDITTINNNNSTIHLKEENIKIANENTSSPSSISTFTFSHYSLLPTKKHPWITKLQDLRRKKRSGKIDFDDIDDDDGQSKHQLLDEERGNGGGGIFDWQARENVAREMEDVFLHGASEALTKYIEKQLHPAIKETLMVSMGYTISYG